jgi:hypothetical protein
MGPQEFERYLGYMHRVYAGQPVFRRFVDANADWYTPDFIRSLTHGPSSRKAAGAANRRPPAGNPAASLDGAGR